MKNTAVPRLRFPEFREEAERSERKLLDVLNEHGSKSTGKEEVFSVSVHKGIINQIEHLGRSFSAATTDHYKRVLPGDVVYTKSPTGDFPYGIIKQSKIEKSVIVSPLYGVFTPETTALGCILDAYFESKENTINYLSSIVQKGAKNTINISNDKFLSKSLFLPSNPAEQKKLATFLTTLDTLISAEGEKLQALQAHKKGLMQVLFPGEGELVPRVRFGEFLGEWEEKTLGELIEIKGRIGYRGYTVEDIVKKGEGAIALSPSNISDSGSLSFEKSTYITWFKYDESPEIMLEEGQTLLVKTGSTYGKTALVNSLPVKATINPQLVVLKPTNINSVFLYLIVSGNSVQKRIEQTVVGGAIPTLSQDSISKFVVLVPSQAEQQKIATTLTALDGLLTAQSDKIDALKRQKKGLMQRLFPGGV